MLIEFEGIQFDVPDDATSEEIEQIYAEESARRSAPMAASHGPADGRTLPSHGAGPTTSPHPFLRGVGDVIEGASSGTRFLRPVSGAISATLRGARGDEGSWGDRFDEDMRGMRQRDAEAQARSPGKHFLGSTLPVAAAIAATAGGALPATAGGIPTSISAMAPQGAGYLPLLARSLAAYADVGIANTASEALNHADDPSDPAVAEAASSPANWIGAGVPAVAELTGPLAQRVGRGELSEAAKRAWLAINPSQTEVAVARDSLGGWDEAGALLRDLRLPDGRRVMEAGDDAATIRSNLQLYRQVAGADVGNTIQYADDAQVRVDLDEVLGRIEGVLTRHLGTRGARAITPEAISEVNSMVNRIRRQFNPNYVHESDLLEYPTPLQGELGLQRQGELVPGPEATVETPPPRPVTDEDGNMIMTRRLAGATVPGAKANEPIVQSEAAAATRRREGLEEVRDRIYNPEETGLPGRLHEAEVREDELDRELWGVQRANENGEIRDPTGRRNRLYGNAGPVKVDPVQVMKQQKLNFLREQYAHARTKKAKEAILAEVERVHAMRTEDQLRSSFTEEDLVRISEGRTQEPTDVAWFTPPRGVDPEPTSRDYGGTLRPRPDSGYGLLTEEQPAVPISQSLALQSELPVDNSRLPGVLPREGAVGSEVLDPRALRDRVEAIRNGATPREGTQHVGSNIRLERPRLSEWEDLKKRIQGYVNDTSNKYGYGRAEAAIENNPVLAALEEVGGVVKTVDEEAIERAFGGQAAADFRAAKARSGHGQALESLATKGADAEAPVARQGPAQASRAAGWGVRHALPLSMGVGAGAASNSVATGAATTAASYVLERTMERILRANARMSRVHDTVGRGLLGTPQLNFDPRSLLPYAVQDAYSEESP